MSLITELNLKPLLGKFGNVFVDESLTEYIYYRDWLNNEEVKTCSGREEKMQAVHLFETASTESVEFLLLRQDFWAGNTLLIIRIKDKGDILIIPEETALSPGFACFSINGFSLEDWGNA